jgi:hypothetical protein
LVVIVVVLAVVLLATATLLRDPTTILLPLTTSIRYAPPRLVGNSVSPTALPVVAALATIVPLGSLARTVWPAGSSVVPPL